MSNCYVIMFIEIEILFNKSGYPFIYRNQDKTPNKKKGSGVGLYVNEKHVYTEFSEQSLVSENIESIFATISHLFGNIYRIYIYRRPGVNIEIFKILEPDFLVINNIKCSSSIR